MDEEVQAEQDQAALTASAETAETEPTAEAEEQELAEDLPLLAEMLLLIHRAAEEQDRMAHRAEQAETREAPALTVPEEAEEQVTMLWERQVPAEQAETELSG